MKDINGEIEYKGKTYNLVFNLNVMEKIQDKFETIDKWASLTSGKEQEVNVKALKYGFTEMINEGLEIEAEENGTEFVPITEKQVGRMTYYLFNKLYQHYKDVFDLELRLKSRDMTYRELYKKSQQEDEWF